MRKLLIWAASLITLMLTLALVMIITLINIDPNKHKDWIAEKFNEETGRTLTLNGKIDLTFYPWLGLELNQITISNAPGFGEEPLLYTERAFVRMKLMPMLDQQYEIDTVLLLGSSINLAINENGQSNWSDLVGTSEVTDTESSASTETTLNSIALGGVDIQNASLSFDDRSNNQHFEISDLNMHTGELVYGQPVELTMEFNANSVRPDLQAQVDFSGTVIYDLEAQQYNLSPLSLKSIISGPNIPNTSTTLTLETEININLANETLSLPNFEFNALGTHISADINGQNILSETPAYKAKIAADGSDLALLFRVAEINDLAAQIESLNSREFVLSASLEADMQSGNASLSELEANLLGADISGTVTASNINTDAPAISGQLSASGPDLPTLLEVAGQIQGGSESSLSQYGRQLSGISNKRFSIDTVFNADLESGTINAPVLNANLLGFTLSGQLSAQNMNDSDGTVSGELSLSGEQLGEVLSALDQNDLGEVVQSAKLSIGIAGNRSSLDITPMTLDIVLDGPKIPNSPVTLGMKAKINVGLDDDSLTLDEFLIEGLGLNVIGQLKARNISKHPEFSGSLNIPAFNARQLLTQLNLEVPETADNSTLQEVSIDTSFEGTAANIRVDKLSVNLDDSSIESSFSITDFENPAVEFSVNIDQINADSYLPPETTNTTTSSSSDSALPLESLRALTINGDMSIAQLTISGLDISELLMAINANNGQILLSPLQALLYEGNYSGEIALDVSSTPTARMEVSLQGIALEPLLNDFMGSSQISGRGNIDFSLNGSGADITAIKSNLNGSGDIALLDGTFKGVDVGGVLTQIETMIRSGKLKDIERGAETAFNEFSADILISNGNVSSNNLLIKAPGFQVAGQGTLVNLNNDSINFQLRTSVDQSTATTEDEEYNIGGYTLPILCTGTTNSPRCLPNTEEILAAALQKTVTRGISELLQRARSKRNPEEEGNAENNESSTDEEQEEPEDLGTELFNRALDRLFK